MNNEELLEEIERLRHRVAELEGIQVQPVSSEKGIRESEEPYRRMVEHLPLKVFVKDMDSVYLLCNECYAGDLGIAAANIIGKTDFDFFPRELAEKHRADDRRMMKLGRVEEIEEQYLDRGEARAVLTVKTPMRDKQGNINGILGIVTDLTERKRAQELLQQTESRYRSLFEHAPSMFVVTRNHSGRPVISDCNKLFLKTLGFSREEVVGRHLDEFYSPDSVADLLEGGGYARALAGDFFIGSRLLVKRDGTLIPTLAYATPERDASGDVTGVFAMFVDITEQKRAEEALQRANDALERRVMERTSELTRINEIMARREKELAAVYDSAPLMMIVLDEDLRVLQANRATGDRTGRNVDEMLGLRAGELLRCAHSIDDPGGCGFGPHCQSCVIGKTILHTLSTGEPRHRVETSILMDGREGPLEIHVLISTCYLEHLGTRQVLLTVEDITDRKRADRALRESEERFRRLVEHVPMGIAMCSTRGEIQYLNEGFIRLLGYTLEDIPTLEHWFELAYPDREYAVEVRSEWYKTVGAANESGIKPDPTVWEVKCKDGNDRIVEFRKTVIDERVVHTLLDITDRKRVEKELQEKESRLKAILNNSLFLMWLKDVEGRFLAVNDVFAESCGAGSAEAVVGKTDFDVWPPELAERYRADDRKTMEEKRQKYVEERVFDRGEIKWFETFKMPIVDNQGDVIGTTGFARDITDRKLVEEKLHWNETLLRHMATSSPLAYLAVDNRTDNILYCNRRFYEIWGIEHLEEKISRGELRNNDIIPDLISKIKDVEAFAESYKPLQSEENRSVVRDEIEFVDDRTIQRFSTELRDEMDHYYGRFYIFEDISDQKRAEKALRESEARYRVLFDTCPDGILIADVERKNLVYSNPAICRMLGYSAEEMAELGMATVHPHDQLQRVVADFEAHSRGKRDVSKDIPFLRKDGTVFLADITSSEAVVHGRLCNVGFIRDVTERSRMEEERRTTLLRFHTILSNLYDSLLLVSDDGIIEFANQAFCDHFRLKVRPSELIGLTSSETIKAIREMYAEPAEAIARIQQIVEQHLPLEDEELEVIDGQTYLRAFIPINIEGKPYGRLWVHKDITDRKKAEEALRKSEAFNRRLVDHAPFGIIYIAGDGTVEYVNPEAKRLGGLTADQVSPILGQNILGISGLQNAPAAHEVFRRLLKGDSVSGIEVPYRSSLGRDAVLLIAATPLLNPDRSLSDAILMFTDISERKRAEEVQRQTARYRAVADLAGGIAHNFNNLLQGVMGYLELALMNLEARDYEAVKEKLETVLATSRSGAGLVRRIQRFALRRDNLKESEIEVFDLAEIAEQAVDVSKGWLTAAEKQGRKVSLYARIKEGCLIKANKNEIFDVIVNLVRNAIEALPERGDVDVTADAEGEKVVFRVKDTGIGLSPEKVGRLFNPFFTTKAEPGAGLSLASGRRIINDFGGQILVDSAEGQGTTFTVVLPLAEKLPEPTKALPERETENRLTILVIDDMEVITNFMKSALTEYGHAVLTAHSGEEGIAIYEENQTDLVISDLGMPGMSGWEVGSRIRDVCLERGVPKTPFVLLTAWAGQELETEKIANSGVDRVMGKPLNIAEMLKVIREIVERSPSKDSEH